MAYLFPIRGTTLDAPDPWQAFVWSSARPENVASMVEDVFGEHADSVSRYDEMREQAIGEWLELDENARQSRVLGVWSRDHMGLSNEDYGKLRDRLIESTPGADIMDRPTQREEG